MSLRHRQLKRNRYYHEREFGFCRDPHCRSCRPKETPWEPIAPDQCWCGVKNPYFAPVGGTCGGSGFLHCFCGGDLCVCHNHGEVQCLGCEDCKENDYEEDADYWEEEA